MKQHVEEFVRYSAQTDTIGEAFEFVMTYIDRMQHPSVEINACYAHMDDEDTFQHYHVSVFGVLKEGNDDKQAEAEDASSSEDG